MILWIARDNNQEGLYTIAKRRRDITKFDVCGDDLWAVEGVGDDELCAEMFEALTGLKLKRGEGPVKIEMKITKARRRAPRRVIQS